ncbi:MAG: chemotaxis protein CheW [Deltaproteobacteria bacterium]|nr:chemotaxis protein CheW [Deltaproteobacteria bacterium]
MSTEKNLTTKKESTELKKFVTLGLGNERYGIEVEKTREIIAKYKTVALPRTPNFIDGIISLRGDIIPVIDLRKRFELPPIEKNPDIRVIVIELRDFSIGIQVDKVYEVIKLDKDSIEPPPPLVSGLRADYLQGVAKINEYLLTVLDLDRIFSTSERLILSDFDDEEEYDEDEDYSENNEDNSEKDALEENEASKPVDKNPEPTPLDTKEEEGQAPDLLEAEVSLDGMIEFRGKSYFVGKKQKNKKVSILLDNGNLKIELEGEVLKEFKI